MAASLVTARADLSGLLYRIEAAYYVDLDDIHFGTMVDRKQLSSQSMFPPTSNSAIRR
jgi:hypothetical protein